MLEEILELKKSSVLWHEMPLGVLRLTGPDAKDFLQRMSTNDLAGLSDSCPMSTSFINSKGRMVDYVTVFAKNFDDLLLVSSHPQAEILLEWLAKFHFIEDFSVSIEKEFSCFYTLGPVVEPPNALLKDTGFFIEGFKSSFSLLLAKEPPQGSKISFEVFDTLRIAALMPLAPFEINDRFMPQNINLQSSIAQKGCYIGQEVILKALTYQKNVKQLSGIRLDHDQWANKEVSVGEILSIAPIFHEGLINALVVSTTVF